MACARAHNAVREIELVMHGKTTLAARRQCEALTVDCAMCGVKTVDPREEEGDCDGCKRLLEEELTKIVCCAEKCGVKAVSKCAVCRMAMCREHAEEHAAMSEHETVYLDMYELLFPQSVCAKHKSVEKYVCKTCKMLVCGDCLLCGDHKGHLYDVVGVPEADKQRVEKAVLETEHMLETLDQPDKDLDAYFDAKLAEVRGEYRRLHERIEREETDTVDKIEEARKQSFKLLEERKALVETLKQEMKDLQERLEMMGKTRRACGDAAQTMVDFAGRTRTYLTTIRDVKVEVDVCTMADNTKPFITAGVTMCGRKPCLSFMKTGFSEMQYGGSVFDPVRDQIYTTNYCVNHGRDIFTTNVATGMTRRNAGVVPFDHTIAPVFDGDAHLYFRRDMHASFGRVNIETMAYERLPSAPRVFGNYSPAFFSAGNIYTFDANGCGMVYNVETQTWKDHPLCCDKETMWRECFAPDPWQDDGVIHLNSTGAISIVKMSAPTLVRKVGNLSECAGGTPTIVVVPTEADHFNIFVCNRSAKGPWRVFSSRDQVWTDLDWPSTGCPSGAAVYDAKRNLIYHHISGTPDWQSVRVPMIAK